MAFCIAGMLETYRSLNLVPDQIRANFEFIKSNQRSPIEFHAQLCKLMYGAVVCDACEQKHIHVTHTSRAYEAI